MNPVDKPHLHVGALSHPGERRSHNEDRYSVTAYEIGRKGTPALLAVVADGVGGHQAGEVAAEMTVEAVVERVASSSGRDPLPTLRAAVSDAAKAVIEAARKDPSLEGMGSTLAIVLVIKRRLYMTYVGDSRIYLLNQDGIRQLSNDHTWVQEALDHSIITSEEAEDHPNAHVLRRHIGGEEIPEPDLRIRLAGDSKGTGSTSHQGMELSTGDTLLLCSDGLTDLVRAEEIAETLSSKDPADAVHSLVELARDRGGHDNITVVALEVPSTPIKQAGTGCWTRGLLTGAAGLVLVFALLFFSWRTNSWPWNTNLLSGWLETRSTAAPETSTTDPPGSTQEPPAEAVIATATSTPTPGPTSTPVPLATVPADADS
ncbi:MAG: PP2C family protein-serine/threonine phosphatase [Anaerolineales bacterium]